MNSEHREHTKCTICGGEEEPARVILPFNRVLVCQYCAQLIAYEFGLDNVKPNKMNQSSIAVEMEIAEGPGPAS